MIDLHSHILPAIDDGSESTAMTAEMARIAAKAGTRHIVCTPHCGASDPKLSDRIDEICRTTGRMNALLADCGIPITLYPGMELFCRDTLLDVLERGQFLTLAGSRYLLIEFNFDAPPSLMEDAAELVADFRLCPVIAHPERYTAIQRDPRRIIDWLQYGTLIQVNKGSILGRFGRRASAAADWILGNGLAHVVASDAHRSTVRTPDLSDAYETVAHRYSHHYAEILFRKNPNRILNDRDIVRPDEF